jgi:hypothetical protein
MSNSERDQYMKSWFEEQPTLSEEMAAADARLKEAETRHLQELERVCALSSPRVAFERRLDYLARTSQWEISDGMVSGSYPRDTDDDEGFGYGVDSTFFDLQHDDKAIAFLCKDQGNFVYAGEFDADKRSRSQEIYLHVLPDPESLTVDELKEELRMRRLSHSGEKADLVARLQKLKESVV